MPEKSSGGPCTFTYNLGGQLLRLAYRTAANSPSGTVADSDTFSFLPTAQPGRSRLTSRRGNF